MADGFYNTDWGNEDQSQSNQYAGYNPLHANSYNQGYTNPAFSGQFQPQENFGSDNMASDAEPYTATFDDEPPLLEELGINFDHIYQKTIAVLNPFRHTESSIVNEIDLTGPFVFCMALGTAMLMAGKVQFGYIYGIGAVGVVGMWLLLNLMAPKGAHLGVIASILGYCILPIVLLSLFNIFPFFDLQGKIGTVASVSSVLWCSLSASKLFSDGLEMKRQQVLVAYPCAILYAVFALLTVF